MFPFLGTRFLRSLDLSLDYATHFADSLANAATPEMTRGLPHAWRRRKEKERERERERERRGEAKEEIARTIYILIVPPHGRGFYLSHGRRWPIRPICLNHRSREKQMRHHARQSRSAQADLRGLSIGRLPEYDRRSAGKYNVRATSVGRSALLQLMNRIDHGRRKERS